MAERDYYEILGVTKASTPDQIKKAYRTLARKYHPDVNPGDKKSESNFKEVQKAYDVLSDAEKRQQYDQFGVAGVGGHAPGAAEWAARQAGGGQGGMGGFENIDLSAFFGQNRGQAPTDDDPHGGSIFEELIGRVRGDRTGRKRPARAPRAAEADLTVPFLTAVRGGETTIEVEREPGRRETLVVKIPPGVETGTKIRLRGKGDAADLTVKLTVEPHRYFRREGRDLLVDAPLSIAEAVLGAKIDVPTLDGLKTMPIPAGTSSGQKLRLRGQGVPAHKDRPAGDLFVVAKIVSPKAIDDESRGLIEQFAERNPSKPRVGLW